MGHGRSCLHHRMILYYDARRYWEAEEAYERALEIRLRLVAIYREVYKPDLADVFRNLIVRYRAVYLEREISRNAVLS